MADMAEMFKEIQVGIGSIQDGQKLIYDKLEETRDNVDKLFEQNDERKKEVATLRLFVGDHTSCIEELQNTVRILQADIQALKSRQVITEEKSELLQNTQHDDYDRAFLKEDFLKVFLFLITFGYNTCSGMTCVVFKEINGVLCVCVNFRALNLIAKLKLSYSQVTKVNKLPPFALFKMNQLRQLFREAKLPQLELDVTDLNDLVKKLCMHSAKKPAGNKTFWIALEADAFVLGVQNLQRAKKIEAFCDTFKKFYPKSVKAKTVSEKDKCFLFHSEDDEQLPVRQPLFQMTYWKELFYPCMKDYQQKLVGDSVEVDGYSHFLTLYSFDADADIDTRDEVVRKRTAPLEHPSDDDDDEPRVPQKRPRFNLSSIKARRARVQEEEEEEE